jgi:hypothetical protein
MRRALALLLVWLWAATAAAQPAPESEAARVLAQWLESTCLGDDAPALRAALREHAAALRPALRRAIDAGPPEAAVAGVRAAASERQRRRAELAPDAVVVTGVSREALARVARTTESDFAADQAARYVQGYRANAIAALAIVGTPDDRALLRRLAAQRNALAPVARAALAAATER